MLRSGVQRASIYARYSSERQRATSIEDQITLCRTDAPRWESIVLEQFICTDEELTGASEQRPGYQRLMTAARDRAFDVILVESQDRLWRDQGEMHHALKRLRFWGVRVIAVTTGTDLTDRTGRLVASVMGWKDEAFLEDLRDKTRRGMMGQVRRGMSAGGRAYGYRSRQSLNDAGQFIGVQRVIDADEAEVVRRIFELYDSGMGPHAIARLLNAEHVLPPRPRRGGRLAGWTWTTINGSPKKAIGILNNPLYAGYLVWNRSEKVLDPDTGKRSMRIRPSSEWVWTKAPELRIIPEELWESVQARRQGRRLVVPGNRAGRHPRYLFSGLLRCGLCGGAYTVKSRTYYGCATHHNRGPMICANSRHVQRERLEAGLLRLIFGDVFAPEAVAYVAQQVRETWARVTTIPDERRQARQAELARAQAELEHIATAIRQGILTPTTKAMLEAAEQRVADCEAVVRAVPSKPPVLPPVEEAVRDYLRELRATMGTDIPAARQLLARGVGTITLRPVGAQLVAEMQGNLAGLLSMGSDSMYANDGAGRGI